MSKAKKNITTKQPGPIYGLPKGWENLTINDVYEKIYTGTTPPSQESKYYNDGSVNWFSPSDFQEQRYLTNSTRKITSLAIDDGKAKLFPEKSLLLIAIGATIGKVGIIKSKASSNQQITCINFKSNIDVDFAYYWFVHNKNLIIDKASAATLPIINQSGIKELPIIIPPLPEQQRIVQQLDALFLRIDKAIQLANENMAHCQHLLPAALNEVFGEAGYQEVLLTEVCEFSPPKSETKNIGEIEVAFVPMADLNEKKMFFYIKQTKQLQEVYTGYTYFRENDVLLAKVTPCFENGKSGIAKDLINKIGFGSSEYYVFRPSNKILAEWIYYNISSSDFLQEGAKNMSGAVGLKRVTKDFINSWKIKLPELSTQKSIVAYLNQLSAKQQQLQQHYSKRLQQLQALKSSLLDGAFKGEF